MTSIHTKRGFFKWLAQGILVFALTFLSGYTPELKPEQRHPNITETRVAITASTRRTISCRIFLDRVTHYIPRLATDTQVAALLQYENKIKTQHRVIEHEQDRIMLPIGLLPVVYSAETPADLPAFS